MKSNRKVRVRVRVRVTFIIFHCELAPTDPWCNMLQTLLGRKNYEEEQPQYENLVRDIFLLWEMSKLWVLRGFTVQPSTRKALGSTLGLLTVMILKRVSESIFFQSSKYIAYKVKEGKETAKSLVAFHLLKIVHTFPGKKHLRT